VTHPFHPLHGLEFESLEVRSVFRHQVLIFYNLDGRKLQIPVAWTDAASPDPFQVIAQGRSYFRVEDLLRLWELTQENLP